MLERLFTSKTRVKLLTLFIMSPEKDLYIREIARSTQENINAVRRELSNLEHIGLLQSTRRGNTKHYTLNKKMSIYPEIAAMVLKTEGITQILKNNLPKIGPIETAFIYGSFAQNKADLASDIDLFLIGLPDEKELIVLLNKLEKQISREINYVLYDPTEFHDRLRRRDSFVSNVLKEPKILLWGDIPDSRWPRKPGIH